MKRRADNPNQNEEEITPTQKKLRSADRTRRSTRNDSAAAPPVFVIEEDSLEMATNKSPSSKPPSAEEFKAMLRDGLANVAKKEQLDVMMNQIKSNSNALLSLERKVDNTSELNEKRFKSIEERLEGPHPDGHHGNSDSRI